MCFEIMLYEQRLVLCRAMITDDIGERCGQRCRPLGAGHGMLAALHGGAGQNVRPQDPQAGFEPRVVRRAVERFNRWEGQQRQTCRRWAIINIRIGARACGRRIQVERLKLGQVVPRKGSNHRRASRLAETRRENPHPRRLCS